MRIKPWQIIILTIFVLGLQLSLLGFMEIGSIKPDWLMLVVIVTSFSLPFKSGIFTNWCIGAFKDMTSNAALGSFAFLYMLIGFVIYLLREIFFGEDIITKAGFTFIATFICHLVYGVGLLIFSGGPGFFYVVFKSLLIALYTTLVGFVAFIIYSIINHLLYMRRLRKEFKSRW